MIPGLVISGATGFLGRRILDRLLGEKLGWRIFLLVRRAELVPAAYRSPQFHILESDLSRPDLGLSEREWRMLTRAAVEIVHCAADRRAELSVEKLRAANARGTANLLRLAAECPELRKFLHLSTTCVAGRTAGAIPEALIEHRSRFSNAYQQTKYEAEQAVAEWSDRVPVAVARISTLVGERDGSVGQTGPVHHLLRLFPRFGLPLLAGDAEAGVDFVAADWAVEALSWLFQNRFAPGLVWHLCAGPAASPTVGELMAATHRLWALHPEGRKWVPLTLPRLAPLAEWEAYVERVGVEGAGPTRELVRLLDVFLPQLAVRQSFDITRTRETLEPARIPKPDSRELWASVVRWGLDTGWGKK